MAGWPAPTTRCREPCSPMTKVGRGLADPGGVPCCRPATGHLREVTFGSEWCPTGSFSRCRPTVCSSPTLTSASSEQGTPSSNRNARTAVRSLSTQANLAPPRRTASISRVVGEAKNRASSQPFVVRRRCGVSGHCRMVGWARRRLVDASEPGYAGDWWWGSRSRLAARLGGGQVDLVTRVAATRQGRLLFAELRAGGGRVQVDVGPLVVVALPAAQAAVAGDDAPQCQGAVVGQARGGRLSAGPGPRRRSPRRPARAGRAAGTGRGWWAVAAETRPASRWWWRSRHNAGLRPARR
jgi:hypothetical protein